MVTNYNKDSIIQALDDKIKQYNQIDDTNPMSILLIPPPQKETIESAEERADRIGLPSQDIGTLLKDFKCEDAVAKMKENDMDDEQFWGLEEGDFEGLLEIKVFGRRKKLFAKVQQIKKEHELEMEELRKMAVGVDKSGLAQLMKRSSTIREKSDIYG